MRQALGSLAHACLVQPFALTQVGLVEFVVYLPIRDPVPRPTLLALLAGREPARVVRVVKAVVLLVGEPREPIRRVERNGGIVERLVQEARFGNWRFPRHKYFSYAKTYPTY